MLAKNARVTCVCKFHRQNASYSGAFILDKRTNLRAPISQWHFHVRTIPTGTECRSTKTQPTVKKPASGVLEFFPPI